MRSEARIINLQTVSEIRGEINILELQKVVGFSAQRFFIVSGVPASEKRGQHAHIEGQQFLVALNGSVKASIFDGQATNEFLLNSPTFGLYMPKMTWGSQWDFSEDAKLLVLCSNAFEPSDYITDISEFNSRV